MRIKYIKELDAVRGLAALSIMWLHFAGGISGSNKLNSLLHKTAPVFQFGVPLFFVLSGFLITRILLATKTDTQYFVNFYAKRSLRIFPLYYFVLLIAFLLIPIATGAPIPSLESIWVNLLYMQNLATTFNWPNAGPPHLWSLAVEEHFYLLWPLLVYYMNKSSLKGFIIFVLCFEPALRYILQRNNVDVYYTTFTRLDELCIGALLAIKELEGKTISKRNVHAILALLVLGGVSWTLYSGKGLHAIQALKFSFFAIIFYLIIGIIALNEVALLKRILDRKPLLYTGKISYGLYIYHPICFMIIDSYVPYTNEFLRFIVCFGITYIIASLSYYCFERRFLELKKYFGSSKEKDIQSHTNILPYVEDETHPKSEEEAVHVYSYNAPK